MLYSPDSEFFKRYLTPITAKRQLEIATEFPSEIVTLVWSYKVSIEFGERLSVEIDQTKEQLVVLRDLVIEKPYLVEGNGEILDILIEFERLMKLEFEISTAFLHKLIVLEERMPGSRNMLGSRRKRRLLQYKSGFELSPSLFPQE